SFTVTPRLRERPAPSRAFGEAGIAQGHLAACSTRVTKKTSNRDRGRPHDGENDGERVGEQALPPLARVDAPAADRARRTWAWAGRRAPRGHEPQRGVARRSLGATLGRHDERALAARA